MKKIFLILGFVGLSLSNALALVTNNTAWEMQADATAASVNGCAFDPAFGGVDYTQQSAAQVTYTDLVLGAGGNTVASVANPFTTDLVGSALHINSGSGFTQGWHTIIAVDGLNVATLFNSGGTAGSTAGGGKVGGACSFNSLLDDDVFENMSASNTVWFKYGLYPTGEAVSISTDATNEQPIFISGYKNTRGDLEGLSLGDAFSVGIPTINAGANLWTFNGDYFNFKLIYNTGTGASASYGTYGVATIMDRVIFRNTSTTINRDAFRTGSNFARVINSDLQSDSGMAIKMVGSNAFFYGNLVHNSSTCVDLANSDINVFVNNVFTVCDSTIVAMTTTATGHIFSGNTFISSAAATRGTGIIQSGGANTSIIVFGNLFYGSAQSLNFREGAGTNMVKYNNFFSNTVNASSTTRLDSSNTFVDPQFPSVVNFDVRPGPNLRNTMSPFRFSATPSLSPTAIGAVQRAEPQRSGLK